MLFLISGFLTCELAARSKGVASVSKSGAYQGRRELAYYYNLYPYPKPCALVRALPVMTYAATAAPRRSRGRGYAPLAVNLYDQFGMENRSVNGKRNEYRPIGHRMLLYRICATE